jgi:hypothetical protein
MEAWRMELGKPHPKESPDTIDYHFQRFVFLRKNTVFSKPKDLKGYLQPATINWYWNGQPSVGDQFREQELHQDALVRLGFFETREFKWSGNQRAFVTSFIQKLRSQGILETCAFGFSAGSNSFLITTRKEEFPAIKKIIDESNAAAAK